MREKTQKEYLLLAVNNVSGKIMLNKPSQLSI